MKLSFNRDARPLKNKGKRLALASISFALDWLARFSGIWAVLA